MSQQVKDAIHEDGHLYDLGWYLCWWPDEEKACLDGEFTADELEAIANHMRFFRREEDA